MLTLFVNLLAISGASAQSAFNFTTSEAAQCQDFTLTWDGGKAPFRLVGIPVNKGNYIDGQHMFNIAIPDPQGSPPYNHTFKMNEPGGTEFIFAMYDAAGFNGANVRPVQKIGNSDDKSCLGKLDVDFALDFTFYLAEPGTTGKSMDAPAQCDTVSLKWNMEDKNKLPVAPIKAFGMIPGGVGWEIPVPSGTTGADGDKGIDWQVKVPGGTPMVLFMTDGGKFGIGGSTSLYTVSDSLQQDCMKSGSLTTTSMLPSSTSGSQTGSPTSSSSSSPSSASGGGGTSTGAIVGAVVGSVAALALGFLAAFLYFRRKRKNQRTGGAVDLHDVDDDPDPMTEQGRQSAQMESLLGAGGSPGSRNRHSRISSGFDSYDGTHRQSLFSESTDYPYPQIDPFPTSSTNPRDSMATSSSSNNRFMTEKQQLAYNERRNRRHDSRAGARSPGSSYALSEYVDAGPVPDQLQALPPPSYDAVLRARNPDPETSSTNAPSTSEAETPRSPPQRYSAISGTDSSPLRQSNYSTSTDTEVPPGTSGATQEPARSEEPTK